MRLSSFFFLLLSNAVFSQNTDWKSKIDPQLLTWAQKADTAVEFLVIMQEQADVSAAALIRKKEDKGRFVFETLSAQAERSQRAIRDLLHQEDVAFQSFWVINALWAKGPKNLIERLAQLPEVGRLEINPVWRLSQPPQDVETDLAPEDRLTPLSWGLTKINADDVWNLGYTGAGVVVGGQDTGYEWSHPALKNKYRGWDGSNVDHNYNWHDAIHALIGSGANSCGINLNHPCDDTDHGTHTMGTMVGGTSADSIFGVAPDAVWMGCRNMEEGDGTPATYIECFQWFIAPTNLSNQNPDASKAPHVINNSWGCPVSEGCNASNFATMDGVVNNVRAAGIVVVVSAGNSGSGCSTVNTPAAMYDGSYSVGATSNSGNDLIASFSSRGPVNVYTAIMKPDISAPGTNIPSCIGTDNQSGTYTYATKSGTSMAGPHIVGLVALLLSARPDLAGDVDAIENLINQTAVPRFATAPFCGSDNGASRPNNVYGWGRADALAAVNTALPVELLAFSARPKGEKVSLQWATGAEIDCSRFSVQRSAERISWKTIGEVSCKGNESQYVFTDGAPHKGLNYYRLEQIDFSGKSTFSPIRVLSMTPTGYSLHIASGEGKIYYEVLGENVGETTWQLEIRAVDGRLLQHRAVGSKGWMELPELPTGVYAAVLRNADGLAIATEKWWWARD